jgi:predicted transcriptional regulator
MAKRIGRPPMKPPARGQRVSLGLKVTAEIKRHLDSAARVSGRTQSQEAEHLIEEGLQSRRMLDVMRTTLAEIERGSVEAAFRRQGYTPVHSPHGKIWLPPGYPTEKSGFIPPEEEK